MKVESKGFFFEPFNAARFRLRGYDTLSSGRKKQKISDPLRAVLALPESQSVAQRNQSLFASFSSEKEVLSFLKKMDCFAALAMTGAAR